MNRHGFTALVLLAVCLSVSGVALAGTPLGTAFTYQGQLKQSGSPLTSTADLQFTLWDSDSGGNQLGSLWPANNVAVTNGAFSVQVDFGQTVFNGEGRWLEIAVRSPAGSGNYTTLSPRQPLTAVPYALQTRGIFVDPGGLNVGIGTTTPAAALHVTGGSGGQEILGEGVGRTGVVGNSTTNVGVFGETFGQSAGVQGRHGSILNTGFLGGTGYGAYGLSYNNGGVGVAGFTDTSGYGYGVTGTVVNAGEGVRGSHANGNYGVLGTIGEGVFGSSASGKAVHGTSSSGWAGWFDGSVFVGSYLGIETAPSAAALSVFSGEGVMLQLRDPGSDGSSMRFLNDGTVGATGAFNYSIDAGYPYWNGWGGGPRIKLLRYLNGNTMFATAADGTPLGNVGIGTTEPHARMEISGAADALRLSGAPNPQLRFLTNSDDPAARSFFVATNQGKLGDFLLRQSSNNVADPQQTGITRFCIAPNGSIALGGAIVDTSALTGASMVITNGNVGIGKTNPQTPLDVQGAVQVTGFTMPTNAAMGKVLTSDASGVGTWQPAPTQPGIPQGVIVMWSGSLATIPSGWVLCNGTNGTPDLRDRFIFGISSGQNPGPTGGSSTHSHTVSPHSHSVTIPAMTTTTNGAHSHSVYTDWTAFIGYASSGFSAFIYDLDIHATTSSVDGAHNHTTSSQTVSTASSTSSTDSQSNLPPYYKLAFIMKL